MTNQEKAIMIAAALFKNPVYGEASILQQVFPGYLPMGIATTRVGMRQEGAIAAIRRVLDEIERAEAL